MPYILRVFENGRQLSQTNNAPQAQGGHETYAQAGWAPGAPGLGLTIGGTYRMDDPGAGGVHRKIIIRSVGTGLNSITYERHGVAAERARPKSDSGKQ